MIAKRSAYTLNVEEAEDPRIMGLLKRGDPSVSRWLPSHEEHKRTLEEAIRVLQDLGARVVLLRRPHAAFDAGDAALVVTVGGDGTLLAASHYVGRVPILGINSDPKQSVGFFCAASRATLPELAERALDGRLSSTQLNRMKVSVNGRIKSTRVLNDVLFCHASPAATSRYILREGRAKEEQRSSGIWVGPAAGSTAAQRSAGGRILPISSKQIQYVVREPYTAPGAETRLAKGVIEPRRRLIVKNKMADARLFFDGPHRVVNVRLGDEIVFESPGEPLTVLGVRTRRRARKK